MALKKGRPYPYPRHFCCHRSFTLSVHGIVEVFLESLLVEKWAPTTDLLIRWASGRHEHARVDRAQYPNCGLKESRRERPPRHPYGNDFIGRTDVRM